MAQGHRYGSSADVTPAMEQVTLPGEDAKARIFSAPSIGATMSAAHDAITAHHVENNSVHVHRLPDGGGDGC